MSRPTHYVPRIGRHLVCALYHEARHRRQPMTRLVEDLLTAALQGTAAWQIAQRQHPPPPDPAGTTPKRGATAVPP
jgi:hypothetical protein